MATQNNPEHDRTVVTGNGPIDPRYAAILALGTFGRVKTAQPRGRRAAMTQQAKDAHPGNMNCAHC